MSRVRIPLSLLKIKARPNGLAFIFIQLDVDSTQSNRGAPAMSRGERGPVDHMVASRPSRQARILPTHWRSCHKSNGKCGFVGGVVTEMADLGRNPVTRATENVGLQEML